MLNTSKMVRLRIRFNNRVNDRSKNSKVSVRFIIYDSHIMLSECRTHYHAGDNLTWNILIIFEIRNYLVE